MAVEVSVGYVRWVGVWARAWEGRAARGASEKALGFLFKAHHTFVSIAIQNNGSYETLPYQHWRRSAWGCKKGDRFAQGKESGNSAQGK
jgi:hypothetical protein